MNRKVKEYKLASGKTYDDLTTDVKIYLKHGYQPWGSMIIDTADDRLVQPMVKYEVLK